VCKNGVGVSRKGSNFYWIYFNMLRLPKAHFVFSIGKKMLTKSLHCLWVLF